MSLSSAWIGHASAHSEPYSLRYAIDELKADQGHRDAWLGLGIRLYSMEES